MIDSGFTPQDSLLRAKALPPRRTLLEHVETVTPSDKWISKYMTK